MGTRARNDLIRIQESIEIKGKVNRKRIKNIIYLIAMFQIFLGMTEVLFCCHPMNKHLIKFNNKGTRITFMKVVLLSFLLALYWYIFPLGIVSARINKKNPIQKNRFQSSSSYHLQVSQARCFCNFLTHILTFAKSLNELNFSVFVYGYWVSITANN